MKNQMQGVIVGIKDYFVEVHCKDAPQHLKTLFIRIGDFNGRNLPVALNATVTLEYQDLGTMGLWVPVSVK